MIRQAIGNWETKETGGNIEINLDVTTEPKINTPILMLNHVLEQIGKHAQITLVVKIKKSDLKTTGTHHTVEDVGIRFGEALNKALGGREGIRRMAQMGAILDESSAQVTVDLVRRPNFFFSRMKELREVMAEDVSVGLMMHFFSSLAMHAQIGIRIEFIGDEWVDGHHIIETIAKAFANALKVAIEIDPKLEGAVLSTKGVM